MHLALGSQIPEDGPKLIQSRNKWIHMNQTFQPWIESGGWDVWLQFRQVRKRDAKPDQSLVRTRSKWMYNLSLIRFASELACSFGWKRTSDRSGWKRTGPCWAERVESKRLEPNQAVLVWFLQVATRRTSGVGLSLQPVCTQNFSEGDSIYFSFQKLVGWRNNSIGLWETFVRSRVHIVGWAQ